jgi:hypothetical protein
VQGVAVWEYLRVAKLILTASAECCILYGGVRVMLLFSWLQYHAEEVYGSNGWAESAVRIAYAVVPGFFSGLHQVPFWNNYFSVKNSFFPEYFDAWKHRFCR